MVISDIRKKKVKTEKDIDIITEISKEKTTIYLTPKIKKTLKKLAIDESKSISYLIEIAIKENYKI